MERITLRQIMQYCSAHPCEVDLKGVIEGISIDSRNLKPGQLFIPIIGEKFNGHNFIDQARDAGAVAVLSSQKGNEPGTLYVEDTLQALLDIACGYRKRFSIRITAVTGSSGKTTTKDMIAAVLSKFTPTLKTESNLNNLVGLPLSVLRLTSAHRSAVFEMGMSSFGEISRMTRAALPDIAVITNIGTAHIEYLGSRKGVFKAKTEILEGLSADGTVILNGDDPMLWELKNKLPYKTVFFGIDNKSCDITANIISKSKNTSDGMRFSVSSPIGSLSINLQVLGRHNVLNSLAAIAVGLEYASTGDAEAEEIFHLINQGLSEYRSAGMRQNIISKGGVTIIDDCYNANPDSMSAALGVLHSYPASGRKIAVLGDMLELGDYSEQAHRSLGEAAAKYSDNILLIGTASENTLLGAIQSGMPTSMIAHFEDREELSQELIKLLSKGDVILIKGSRGMKLEQVRDALIKSLESDLEEQGDTVQ